VDLGVGGPALCLGSEQRGPRVLGVKAGPESPNWLSSYRISVGDGGRRLDWVEVEGGADGSGRGRWVE
jgi:hypothetical protein